MTNRGWSTQLQEHHVFTDIINRGVGGRSTRIFLDDSMPILRKELTRWIQPSIITVWLGANDAADPAGRHGHLAVPVDKYRENLEKILRELLFLAPQAKILLLTPTPVDADERRETQVKEGDVREPPDRTNSRTETYVAACKAVGSLAQGVTTFDMFGYFMTTYPNATERATFLIDGLHLSPSGNDLVFKLIEEQIKALL